MGHSHRDSALPFALAYGFLIDGPPIVRLSAGALVWASSTFPDYDHPMFSRIHPGAVIVGGFAREMADTKTSKDKSRADVHRGASHSVGGVVYLGAVVALIALWTPALASTWWVWAGAVMLGAAVHIAGDCLTPSGCPIFWPFKVNGRRFHRYSLDVFTTGDDVNEPVVGMIVFRPTTALVALWMSGLLGPISQALFGQHGLMLVVLGWIVVVVVVLFVVRWAHHLSRRVRREGLAAWRPWTWFMARS